jgi:O-antigen/teichoic acid export membrane protein
VVFRWGVDTAFMRLYYDCVNARARQRLASTIFFFLLGANGFLVVIGVMSAKWLSGETIGAPHAGLFVALTIVNTFIAGFYFIPYQVLRIGERSGQYVSLTFGRSAATIIARVVFVIWMGKGVLGIVLADIVVTTALTLVLIRWFVPLIRPVFSRPVIDDALRFGLPRIPHSIAQQILGVSDRYFLKAYGTLTEVGLYSIGSTFGLALKLFLSAFESAWTPFFLAVMTEPDAPRIYSTISTYIVAVLVLLTAGLCVVAPAVVDLATAPAFHGASAVTPWIAISVMFQGLYLVGSIGIVITKRTMLYPISTGVAAAVTIVANMILIPRYGMLGAAYANVVAYAALAGVTGVFSWRVYPIHYEWSRLLRIGVAGGVSYIVAVWSVPSWMHPFEALLVGGSVTVPAYLLSLYVTGFFHVGELQRLGEIRRKALTGRVVKPSEPVNETVEMAGDLVASAPEIPTAAFEVEAHREETPLVNPRFPDPRR